MTKRIEIHIDGMTCGNCALKLQRKLESIGATNVFVDHANNKAVFQKPDTLTNKHIFSAIRSIGFIPHQREESEKRVLSSIEKKFLFSLIWSLPLLSHMVIKIQILHNPWFQLLLCVPAYMLGVIHFGRSGYYSLKNREPNMDVLIFIGTSAAFFYSVTGSFLGLGPDFLFYETTSTIVSLVLLGNVLEHRSLLKTTSAIGDLEKLQVKTVKRLREDDSIEECSVEALQINDLILINTGDTVPTDSKITWGTGLLNESMLTGESFPAEKNIGEIVASGTILEHGTLRAQVIATQQDSTLASIIQMVEGALSSKPAIQKLGDKVSGIFVPIVLMIALATFFISVYGFDITTQNALLNAVAVLVIACPCAMGLATPTAVIVAIGKIAKKGILIKGGKTLEELAQTKVVIFDKTGTLTSGKFSISHIEEFIKTDNIRSVIKSLETHSSHPIAKSLTEELQDEPFVTFSEILEQKGLGITGIQPDGTKYTIGSFRVHDAAKDTDYDLYIVRNNELIAGITIKDTLRTGTKELIEKLHHMEIHSVVLSGDREKHCKEVAKELGITEYYSEQSPEKKLKVIANLQQENLIAFVGDGINDAPALACANVGISLSDATEVAIQSAQVVLLNNNITALLEAITMSRKCFRTIKQNLFWAFLYNVCAIPVAAIGYLNPMIAAFAMAFSDVIVIGNSLRLKYSKP